MITSAACPVPLHTPHFTGTSSDSIRINPLPSQTLHAFVLDHRLTFCAYSLFPAYVICSGARPCPSQKGHLMIYEFGANCRMITTKVSSVMLFPSKVIRETDYFYAEFEMMIFSSTMNQSYSERLILTIRILIFLGDHPYRLGLEFSFLGLESQPQILDNDCIGPCNSPRSFPSAGSLPACSRQIFLPQGIKT